MNTMDMPLVFPFHYGQEADQYSFYKVPKVLFTSPVFEKLSTEAKLLYGLLLDRMQLSIRNGWVDEQGRVYIYFTVESIMRALNCGNKKAGGLLNELDDKKGIGLITRIRQGQGRPDKLLIHRCTVPEMSYVQVKTCQNDMSRDAFSIGQEMSKGHANNTKGIKTEENETHIYLSGEERIRNDANVYEQYRTFF